MFYKHKNCHSVVVSVVKFIRISKKDYVLIKVRWHAARPNAWPRDIGVETWLTTADSYGKKSRDRRKYPMDLWYKDWERYEICKAI